MAKDKQETLFKQGIWIKEQQGTLTMGPIGGRDDETTIVPDDLCSRIFQFEQEMIDALYSHNRILFRPDIINIEKLLFDIKARFNDLELRLSFSNPENQDFKGNYDELFHLIERLVLSSSSNGKKPLIHINASMVQGHLCLIYRDSESVSDPSKLAEELNHIKDTLKGEASFKKTSDTRSYYDIMIPSKV